MRYEGKVALVTGAAGGIGQVTAGALAREGASLALWDRNSDALDGVAQALAPAEVLSRQVDVTSQSDVSAAMEEVRQRFGRVDLLAHCAGVMSAADLQDCEMAEWQRVIQVNLTGTFLICQAAVPVMKAAGGGRIVLLSSGAAKSAGTICGIGYVASKAGVLGMVRQMAYRLAPHGINVNAVAPGFVDTEMPWGSFSDDVIQRALQAIPARRMARPDEIAEAILYLGSDIAAYVTGECLDVNGGSLID